MKINIVAAAAASVAVLWAGAAGAQTIGDYTGLDELYRFDVEVGAGPGAVDDQFGYDDLEDAEDVLSPAFLTAHFPTYNSIQPVNGAFDLRGVELLGRYQAGSPQFILQIPDIYGAEAVELCQNAPGSTQPCTFTYNGATRQQAYDEFLADIDELEADSPLLRALLRAMTRRSPIDPLAGNPESLQGSQVRATLDLTSGGDSAIEPGSGEAEPWMIGAAYSTTSSGRFDGSRIDARLQRTFRPREGSRAGLKVNVPLYYAAVNGAVQMNLSFSAGYEIPIIADRWSIEPRVSYGLEISEDLGSAGEVGTASVASRYRIDGFGRGYAVIGNMVGYTSTLSTGILEDAINPEITNWVFRNGAAYELPLKTSISGRSTSLRGSYTYTNFTGDELYLDAYHEASISFGVRARDTEAKIGAELARFALVGTWGEDYQSVSLQVGFRF